MPNYCENELTVTGPRARQDEFREKVKGDNVEDGEVLDANKIIPYPSIFALLDKLDLFEVKQGKIPSPELTAEESKLLLEAALAGYDTKKDGYNQGGYEWCLVNWGTKWGFCDSRIDRETSRTLHYSFLTAWSPPTPLIKKVGEMFPGLSFRLKYFEGGAGFQGVFAMKDGQVVEDVSLEYSGNRGG